MHATRPEVLAPAGTPEAMRAAIRAGADAVYFGLHAFNARARATNFDVDSLPGVMAELHAWGVKGYVTMNILVFDHELAEVERTIRACADAGVDAIIVQDLGLVRIARAIAPGLAVHASTQMTCTDAASVQFAHALGAERVVVGRELSVDDIAAIRAATDVELEVFVHGALCVSYSGQCLTSEAIGGRSANRGACAQACRLPYDLVVDGQTEDLGERAYLLSPQDLEASSLVPRLAELGVSSLKIEGRLKGPEYVASAVQLYRAAVDGASADTLQQRRQRTLVTYSRGSGTGFLGGTNHQSLVEGKTCEHRGVVAGEVLRVERGNRRGGPFGPGRTFVVVKTAVSLARGDGVMIEGGLRNDGEVGGRVWILVREFADVEGVEAGQEVGIWLGPDVDVTGVQPGRRIFLNDDPALDKEILHDVERAPSREPVDIVVQGDLGVAFSLRATTAHGLRAHVRGDAVVEAARTQPLTDDGLRDKLGRLGDTSFELRTLTNALPAGSTIAVSSLNRARRALVEQLQQAARVTRATSTTSVQDLLADAPLSTPPPPPGLFVLCRTEEQAVAALLAGADGVWLDFLAMTGTSLALQRLRDDARFAGRFVGVAPPRIRKPGEDKIDRFLLGLRPDGVLVRGLGALHELSRSRANGTADPRMLHVGDFSLNVTNRLTAREVMAHGLSAFVPGFDLDATQLHALLSTSMGPYAELVVHHPMPLFHTEHCVFASLLSSGADYRTCGRPCERHSIALRDRVGMDHPVEADVGCRNTVFHARAQSAAGQVHAAQASGVKRFRIELVRERADDVTRVVQAYRALLSGAMQPAALFKHLHTEGGVGVVKGSLRVLHDATA